MDDEGRRVLLAGADVVALHPGLAPEDAGFVARIRGTLASGRDVGGEDAFRLSEIIERYWSSGRRVM